MRLLLFITFIPLLLTSQTDSTATTTDFWHRYRPRIGVIRSTDSAPKTSYSAQRNILIGIPQRIPVYDYTFGWQPWEKITSLRAQVQIGYYETIFEETLPDIYRSGMLVHYGFEEYIEYNNWQLGAGFQTEPLSSRAISPFFNAHFLLAIPTKLYYEFNQTVSVEDSPNYREIKGGARVSPGWKAGAGIRVLVHSHLCLTIGGYYINQRVLVNWPTVVGRNHKGSILHVQNTGLQIGALMGW
jgi:hypothetical protein